MAIKWLFCPQKVVLSLSCRNIHSDENIKPYVMKIALLVVLLSCISCSVSKNTTEEFYFSCTSDYGYNVYPTTKCAGETIAFIPSRAILYTKTPRKRKKVYVTYGSVSGWIFKPKFKNINSTTYRILPRSLVITQDSLLSVSNKTKSYISPNSNSSFSPKTIHVKGYYRKDGTYVRPHMRSAPKRRY
jgi:hypothetical protein